MDGCEECGFVYDLGLASQTPELIVAGSASIGRALAAAAPKDLVRRREPDQWSPLEYGCHLRDVLLVLRERVLLARRVDRPTMEPMGRDERVVHDGYAEQAPGEVVTELEVAAGLLAWTLGRLGPGDWERTVVYNYPTSAVRPLRWVALHGAHEVRHHLLDVSRQLPGGGA